MDSAQLLASIASSSLLCAMFPSVSEVTVAAFFAKSPRKVIVAY